MQYTGHDFLVEVQASIKNSLKFNYIVLIPKSLLTMGWNAEVFTMD